MQKLSVNGERLKQTLQAFAEIGRTEGGGVTRLALTEEDKRARDYFCQCCREWGMDVKVDDLGISTPPWRERRRSPRSWWAPIWTL